MHAFQGRLFRSLPLPLFLIGACASAGVAGAQTTGGTVNLASVTSPSSGQPGVTSINLIGTNYPSGTINAAQVQITLTPASAGSNATVSFSPSAVITLFGSSQRVTFTIPSSISVTAPVLYLVSIAGQTSDGVSFSSGNSSALTINPAAQIVSISPNAAAPGQSFAVTISGNYTTFTQLSTIASFGPGISVGGAPSGTPGPVTVSDQSAATAQLVVDATASAGPRNVSIQTGIQVATLANGFTISVSTAPPSISLQPNSGQQAQQGLLVIITGQNTHFAQGTTTANFGSGITVASLTVNSATSATAAINIDAAAMTGPRTVTLTTGTEVASLAAGFNVTAGPITVSAGPDQTAFLPALGLPREYSMVTLPTLGGVGAAAADISDSGDVGGQAQDATGLYRPVIWRSGNAIQIPTLGGAEGEVMAININGQAAGQSEDSGGNWRDFNFDGSTVNDIGPSLHGCCTWKMGINRLDAVVGMSSFTTPAFLYSGDAVTALAELPGGTGAQAYQINDSGLIVGRGFLDAGAYQYPVSWSGGQIQALPTLPGLSQGAAEDVNNFGEIVGEFLAGGADFQAVEWERGAVIPLQGVTVARSINNSHQIVVADNNNHWFVWQDGLATDLTAFISCSPPDLVRINDSGQIAGYCYGAPQQAFVLNPIKQSITTPQVTTLLNGSASDNGIPLTTQWTKVSGPGPVSFANAAQPVTSASFTQIGTYTLRLTASSSQSSSGADVTVTIENENHPPSVNAGPNQTITLPSVAYLVATVTDDGLPMGSTISLNWLKVSGPGAVTFSQPGSATTTASFSQLGTYLLRLVASDGQLTSAGDLTVVVLPATLSITISPNSGAQGQQNLSVAITGQNTNFVQGTTTASFGAGITVASLTVNSATSATAVITVEPAAPLGARDVTLTTGVEVATDPSGFTVQAGTGPSITTVSPNFGPQGGSGPIAIQGQNTHFQQGVTTLNFGPGITVSNINVACPTCLTATLAVDAAAAPGPRTVTATTGGEVASLANGFTVVQVTTTPILTSIVPAGGLQGQSFSVAITGQNTHWVQGTTQVSFGAGITTTAVNVSSATSLSAQIAIDAAATVGLRTVTVTTGSEVASVANVFNVQSGTTAIIYSLNPGGGQQGQQNLPVMITGQNTHFTQGTTTASFGLGVTVVSLTVANPTSAAAVVNIDPAATPGARTVTLTTGSEVAGFTNGFTVVTTTAIISSLDPGGTSQGAQNLPVSITGQNTHWVQGASAASFGAGITVVSLTVTSATAATAVINVDPVAAIGQRTVTVTTGTEVASFVNGFSIIAGVAGITEINPGGGPQGAQNLSVAVTAQYTHWVLGTTTASFGAGVTVVSLTITSPMTATAVVNIDPAASLGGRNVVFTTGSEIETAPGGFTITAGVATLTQVSPNNGQQGQQNLSITITGALTHFAQGTTQAFFGANITIVSLTVNSPTSATAVINIDPSAATGPREVAVQTGSEVASLNNAFNITAPSPILLSVNPNTSQQGQQNLTVTITGQYTHFAQGSTTANFGAGVTVTSLTVNSLTSVTALLNTDAGAASGARIVMLTTGGETVRLAGGFKIIPVGQPSTIDIELGQDVAPAGAPISFSAVPRDPTGASLPGTPSCALSSDATTASGTVPALVAASIETSADTRGIYVVTCTLSSYSLTTSHTFTVIAPAGTGTTQPGLFGVFSGSINSAGQATSAIVSALQANNPSEINAQLTQLRAARDAVDYDALDRTTPFAPEAGFPASPEKLPSFGINPTPQDSNVNPYLSNLVGELNSLTSFLQTHPLSTLSAADSTTYAQLQSDLTALVSQLATFNPSAYGVVANDDMWNLLGADALPQYFQALANATDQLLVANGYNGMAVARTGDKSAASGQMMSFAQLGQIRPDLFGVSLEDLTFATALQMQLIQQIYGQYFNYLYRAIAIITTAQAFQTFTGGLALDEIITGASLSFDIFHAAGSIIESSAVNLIPKRNDVFLIGPDQENALADVYGILNGLLTDNKPKNLDDVFEAFQKIKEKLSEIKEKLSDGYTQAHQLPDSTTDFCIIGNSPPCNQAVYSNGFNSVYAAGGLPLPAPVLILVHNLTSSNSQNGLWALGVFNFLPSN